MRTKELALLHPDDFVCNHQYAQTSASSDSAWFVLKLLQPVLSGGESEERVGSGHAVSFPRKWSLQGLKLLVGTEKYVLS